LNAAQGLPGQANRKVTLEKLERTDPMSEETPVVVTEQRSYSGLFLAMLAVAIVAAIAGLGWSYYLSGRLTNAEAKLGQAQQQNDKLGAALEETNARLKVTSDTLGHSLGLTQHQLEVKAQDLLRRQQADTTRLESENQATQKAVSSVSSDVSSVKTDVGGVKSDLGSTKTELKTAETQLQSMKGDMGVQSGLIATNHDQLEILKHKGDRNYFEFTLNKGQRKPVSTVSLELKKADTKHSRYTLEVYADDKKIEKKDRGLNEPVQFYTGKDNYLYELVVNSIDKNVVKGYISTPKSAPAPVTTSGQ
jgi:DNA repair exonuclease SbcCD ATPase subunit